MGLKLFK